jgi:hypothetical protein
MPPLLQRVSALAGVLAAVQFARSYGGLKIYIPKHLNQGHFLAHTLGLAAAHALAADMGGEDVMVPSAGAYLNWIDARALRVCGLSHSAIATRLQIGLRRVGRLLQGFDAAGIEPGPSVQAIAKHYHIGAPSRPRIVRPEPRPDYGRQIDFGFPAAPNAPRRPPA